MMYRVVLLLLILCNTSVLWAFPSTPILDTFTGADNTTPPNSNWTNAVITESSSANVHIRSNQITNTTTAGGDAYWNPGTFTEAQEAYADITNIAVGKWISLHLRLTNIGASTTDGYIIYSDDALSQVLIGRRDNGSFTQLGAAISQTVEVGDKIGARLMGDQICAWYYDANAGAEWREIGCRTDSTYVNAGNIGISVDSTDTTTGISDNFGGGHVLMGSFQRRQGG